jgi:hypothetical protein
MYTLFLRMKVCRRRGSQGGAVRDCTGGQWALEGVAGAARTLYTVSMSAILNKGR